jgi:NAD(P)-dependent dehydrogenase (short-subunit alcohol dehydrogenase family)
MLLEGKVAIVTGAAQGIGRSVASRFAEHGAKVLVGDILTDQGQALAQELTDQGHQARFARMDVVSLDSIERAMEQCLEAFGAVDILVNNAGINQTGAVVDLEPEAWERVLDVNLTGSFLCSHVVCRQMILQGRGGSVLFTSSEAGKRGEAGASAYAASKFGVIGLMQCLALEMAPYDIRVNAVCPGSVDTPMIHWLLNSIAEERSVSPQEEQEKLLDAIPLHRLAQPDEIADVFVFLASPMASYITGEAVNVDGGGLSG